MLSTGSRPAGSGSCHTWAQWPWLPGVIALRNKESSQNRDQTCVPCICRRILIHCTNREALPLPSSPLFPLFLFFQKQEINLNHGRSSRFSTLWLMLDPVFNPACTLKRGQMIHKYLKRGSNTRNQGNINLNSLRGNLEPHNGTGQKAGPRKALVRMGKSKLSPEMQVGVYTVPFFGKASW